MPSESDPPIVWVPESVQSDFSSLGDTHYPLETGGIVLGYVSDGSYVVTAITDPGPKAVHSRSNYTPDNTHDRAVIIKHFENTRGNDTYLGDWHTHPDASSAMSSMDRRTLRRIADKTKDLTVLPIMMIVSGSSLSWSLSAYQYNPKVTFQFLRSKPITMQIKSCADQQIDILQPI